MAPGIEVKLIPDDENRYEVRLRGPIVTPGYFEAPEKTTEAFDEEGFFITGDAMAFVEPGNEAKGLRFDGRIAEEFKLLSGTWVRAATLRLDLLIALKGLALDVILTGADRGEVGLMVVPAPRLREGAPEDRGVLIVEGAELVERLRAANAGKGPSARVTRVQVLAEPPSIAEGEITAKGNLNFRKILTRRAALLDRLYDDADRGTLLVTG